MKPRIKWESRMEAPSSGKPTHLLSLPVELLVYIMSFLPAIRDIVKLRYVSKKLRGASEAPSLWRRFSWQLYDVKEERSLINVLNVIGGYIKQLIFPNHVTPSSLFKMLSHCNNVTTLNLPPGTELDSEQLRAAVQHMEHLEKLEVQSNTDIGSLLQISGLKELTVISPKRCRSLWSHQTLPVTLWMVHHDFVPCKLNLITETLDFLDEMDFVTSFIEYNYIPPIGHTSYFKLYYNYRIPLNLFPSFPVYQFKFTPTSMSIILPFVKASSFGLFGLGWDILVITEGDSDGKTVYKAGAASQSVYTMFCNNNVVLNSGLDSLNRVTEFDFAYCDCVHSGHLEQLAITCPNLQRLNLENNAYCLRNLKGLRAIAQHCCSMCGLNLKNISTGLMESHMRLWNILCEMNLTHLAADLCVFNPATDNDFGIDEDEQQIDKDKQQIDKDEQQMSGFYHRCTKLRGIEVDFTLRDGIENECYHCEDYDFNWLLLGHFPAVEYVYCHLSSNGSNVLQDVINSCKGLSILLCHYNEHLLIPSVATSNLEQLSIETEKTDIPDIFMDSVSSHGRLVHVVMSVNSVTTNGITSLVVNSVGLLTLHIFHSKCNVVGNYLRNRLVQRFPARKLFCVGSWIIERKFCRLRDCGVIQQGAELSPLWPLCDID